MQRRSSCLLVLALVGLTASTAIADEFLPAPQWISVDVNHSGEQPRVELRLKFAKPSGDRRAVTIYVFRNEPSIGRATPLVLDGQSDTYFVFHDTTVEEGRTYNYTAAALLTQLTFPAPPYPGIDASATMSGESERLPVTIRKVSTPSAIPGVVRNLRASNGNYGEAVMLTFDGAKQAEHYELEAELVPGSGDYGGPFAGASRTQRVILESYFSRNHPDSGIRFRLRGVNSLGQGPWTYVCGSLAPNPANFPCN